MVPKEQRVRKIHSAFFIAQLRIRVCPSISAGFSRYPKRAGPFGGPNTFKCSAEVNSACAKVFACGENACTARCAARPVGG